MNATEQLHAFQQRTESLRQMVETRDLIIKDLEREIRELFEALNGAPAEWDGKRTEAGCAEAKTARPATASRRHRNL